MGLSPTLGHRAKIVGSSPTLVTGSKRYPKIVGSSPTLGHRAKTVGSSPTLGQAVGSLVY